MTVRSVVQRVQRGKVTVAGEEVGAIGHGLLALVGVVDGDGLADVSWLTHKLLTLRIFTDHEGRMNRSVVDTGGAILLVSQFTLAANIGKGARPSFMNAMHPDRALELMEALLSSLRESVPVSTGRFGADMQVELVNDGPVTLWLDSRRATETFDAR